MRKTLRSSDHRLLLDVLRTARRNAGFTQQELARKLRKPQSFVAKYENGERRIDVVEFVAIAHALKVDPLALFQEFLEPPRAGDLKSARIASQRPAGGPRKQTGGKKNQRDAIT
jgi:transcriptional regulator with XRE-family HTH domain